MRDVAREDSPSRAIRADAAPRPTPTPSAGGSEELIPPAPNADERKPEALQGFRILVVDDEADARALIKFALESHGAHVTETDRVSSALALLTDDQTTSRFDVLVSDIGMPERDGFELVTDLRAWERPRALRIPALALSGRAAPEDRRRALECGFDRHLAKPVDLERLLSSIRELAFRSHRTH